MPLTNTLTKSKDRISGASARAQEGVKGSREGAANFLESASRRIRGTSKAASKTIAKRGVQAADSLESASARVRPVHRSSIVSRRPLQALIVFSLLALVVGLLVAQKTMNGHHDFDDDEDDLF